MLNTQQVWAAGRASRIACPPAAALASLAARSATHRGCLRLSLAQLLQLVVERPNKSACDMRFLTHIWEALLRWCASQFEAHVGVKLLGMGEFCYRKDTIGGLEFLNPMFIMSESFAHSYGLHDRRPKNVQVADAESKELDMNAIATLTTEIIGEVVGRDTVENAIHDVIDRVGEVCADPDAYGVVMVDFGFAKLTSENKSVEFAFGAGAPAAAKGKGAGLPALGRPATGASDSGMSVGGSSMMGRPMRRDTSGDAPLQRPHRPHIRPKYSIRQVTKEETLASHMRQLELKDGVAALEKEEEMSQHMETLQRLRSEMVLDYSQREQRKDLMKVLAVQQREQREEKRQRDGVERRVAGPQYWPFRTEELVQQAAEATNRAQKAFLDQQLAEKREKLAYLKREAEKQRAAEQQQALDELKQLQAEPRRQGKAPPPQGGRGAARPAHSVEVALEDAFSRYEDYLHARKDGIESTQSFVREQRYLSEQAELLKGEENRRRLAEMRAYLDRQVRDKETARAEGRKAALLPEPKGRVPPLPRGSDIDAEEEAYVKMALKHALDGQVERKQSALEEEKASSILAEQRQLGHVAQEMQDARYRAYAERREQEAALKSTWAKQLQLKTMEATLEKAEAV
jgi:hypothetical protein